MIQASPEEVTGLLRAWSNGDESALESLIPLVYAELHRLARQYMRREQAGHTLQTSALVNEAYLRLVDARSVQWQSRAHFFAVSATIMRRILVDFARARRKLKRGGGAQRISLDDSLTISDERGVDLISLDEALSKLAALNDRQCKVVELRYFAGLSENEIAEALKISPRTVRSDWNVARTWLYHELSRT